VRDAGNRLTLTRPCARVQVLTILVPFIRETRHLDVCPEYGSGHDIEDRGSSDPRFVEVPSSPSRRRLSHVSASCLRGRGAEQPVTRRVAVEAARSWQSQLGDASVRRLRSQAPTCQPWILTTTDMFNRAGGTTDDIHDYTCSARPLRAWTLICDHLQPSRKGHFPCQVTIMGSFRSGDHAYTGSLCRFTH